MPEIILRCPWAFECHSVFRNSEASKEPAQSQRLLIYCWTIVGESSSDNAPGSGFLAERMGK